MNNLVNQGDIYLPVMFFYYILLIVGDRVNNKGFTLIEMLAVVVIIAVVGIISAPSILSMIRSGEDSSYKTLVSNIKTAAIELYQEKDYMGTNIYKYSNDGRTGEMVTINSGSITINLQTLVGNGFLIGSNNSGGVNKNNKVILEPYNNKDIGDCKIKITKVKNANVCYKIEVVSGNASYCPSYNDFGGDKQCAS